MNVNFKGLVSFGIGGTIVLMVLWNLLANTQMLQYGYDFGYVLGFALQNGIFNFIGFLLVGVGLRLMLKSEKAET
jgi:hypothetical protein